MNSSYTEFGKMAHAVYRLFKRRFDEQSREVVKISTEQFGLLLALSKQEEEVIQKDMAEMMGKDKSAILRLIDNLEEKELVRRVADNKDRRKNYLMVTKTGYRVLEQYQEIVNKLMVDISKGLTDNEIEIYHKVVQQIRLNAENLISV